MEVLRGASSIMDKCELLLLERSLLEYHKGASLLAELIAGVGTSELRSMTYQH